MTIPVPPPGPHGGDVVRLARWLGRPVADLLDLSASLNPAAPDVGAVIAEHMDAIDRYPDPGAATEVLAAAIRVDPDLLVLTNGAAEAIALVAGVERVGAIVEPEFALYRRHLEQVTPDGPRWRSNPSNPTGRLAPPDDTARVWDEAFYPLAAGVWSRGDAASWRIGSLTKVWSCPGLRIGYVIAPGAAAAADIRARQPRWAVNGLALAVVEALAPTSDPASWTTTVATLRGRLVAALTAAGLAVTDTDCCWVLVDHPGLRELLAPVGIVVRDCASFGLPGIARVAVPGDDARGRLVAALERVMP
jgi:histidinol-phosphate/aromatic aminotransferase/cobyric acid decarboxylase-like protein